MKLDFTQKLKSIYGDIMNELLEETGERQEITLSTVCVGALMSTRRGVETPFDHKILRFKLAQKIVDCKDCNLETKEHAMLIELVEQIEYIPFMGAALAVLDPKQEDKKDQKPDQK